MPHSAPGRKERYEQPALTRSARRIVLLPKDELRCFCDAPFVRRHLIFREDLYECGAVENGQRCGRLLYLLAGWKSPDPTAPMLYLLAEATMKDLTQMEAMKLESFEAVLLYLSRTGLQLGGAGQ